MHLSFVRTALVWLAVMISTASVVFGAAGESVRASYRAEANVGSVSSAGSALQAEPVLVSLVMHNEEPRSGVYPDFVRDEAAFWQHRAALVRFADMLHEHGVTFNYQSDWNFLMAIGMYDTGTPDTGGRHVLAYLRDLGFEIDPHTHESRYNYADVAYLIDALGVTPSAIAGGFLAAPAENSKLEYLWQPLTATLDPGYVWQAEALWGGGTANHRAESALWVSGIWKPRGNSHFLEHDDAAPLPHIGGYGRDCGQLLDLQAQGVLEAGRIHTCSIFVGQKDLLEPGFIDEFEQTLLAMNAAGSIRWAGLAEALDIWQTTYGGEPHQLPYRPPSQLSQQRCGDGVCDGPENSRLCPVDCPADSPPAADAESATESATESALPLTTVEEPDTSPDLGPEKVDSSDYRYVGYTGTIFAAVDETAVSSSGTWDLFDYTGQYSINLWFPPEGGNAVFQHNTIALISYENRHFGSTTCSPCEWMLDTGYDTVVNFELVATLELEGLQEEDEVIDSLTVQLAALPAVELHGTVTCPCPPGTAQTYQDPTAYPTMLSFFLERMVKPVKLDRLATNSWEAYPVPPWTLVSIRDETIFYRIVEEIDTSVNLMAP